LAPSPLIPPSPKGRGGRSFWRSFGEALEKL